VETTHTLHDENRRHKDKDIGRIVGGSGKWVVGALTRNQTISGGCENSDISLSLLVLPSLLLQRIKMTYQFALSK